MFLFGLVFPVLSRLFQLRVDAFGSVFVGVFNRWAASDPVALPALDLQEMPFLDWLKVVVLKNPNMLVRIASFLQDLATCH